MCATAHRARPARAMLLALLLAASLAPAAPDWVEISQQHYRKPTRAHTYEIASETPLHPTQELTSLSAATDRNVKYSTGFPKPDRNKPAFVTHEFEDVPELLNPANEYFPTKDKYDNYSNRNRNKPLRTEAHRDGPEHPHLISNPAMIKHHPENGGQISHISDLSKVSSNKPVRTHAYKDEFEWPHPGRDPTNAEYPSQEANDDAGATKGIIRFTPNKDSLLVPSYHSLHEDKLYSNYSVIEHSWNRNKYQTPGNVKRVDDDDFKLSMNIQNTDNPERYGVVNKDSPELTRNRVKDSEKIAATVERVPNIGNVKRVQLSNSPVKSPSIPNGVNSNIRRNTYATKSDNDQDDKMVSIPDGTHIFSSIKQSLAKNYNKIMTSTYKSVVEPSTPTFSYSDAVYSTTETNYGKTTSSKTNHITTKEENYTLKENTKDVQIKPFKPIDTNMYDKAHRFLTNEQNNEPVTEDDDIAKVTIDDATEQNIQRPNTINEQSNAAKNKNDKIKVNALENIMKFMKIVTDTISKNTKTGVGSKVKYLNELKDTLLASIKSRIDATWPDERGARAQRRSRAAAARGHVEFPSSESALMTISFLTFAVFLIKLVLQVIQTYKNKAMMVAPLVVATAGRTLDKLRHLQ